MDEKNRKGRINNLLKFLTIAFVVLILPSVAFAQKPPATGGEAMYRDYCGSCHGADGKGNGPLVPVLTVHPSDLTQLTKGNKGVFPALRLAKIIDGRETVKGHGTADMPAWGRQFTMQETGTMGAEKAAVSGRIQTLIAYLNSIQEK